MDSFKAFEAATMLPTIGSGSGTIDIDPPEDDNGDDGWDSDDIRKRFWETLLPWVQSSKTANLVRFNVYETMLRKVRPTAKSMIWSAQGDIQPRKIVKTRSGYARAILEWSLPMSGLLWDRLVEQQREILAKSDMYKAFGKEGHIGSAALLFKGEVLEFMVYICCAITTGNEWTNLSSTGKFTSNILKLAKTTIGNKIEEWLKKRIVERLRAALIIANVRGNELSLPNLRISPAQQTHGRTQAYDGNILLNLDQTYAMSF
jgi:hypothetical protein